MKCVIHIGTEKTGTTLIQQWLYGNQRNLRSQGIALSEVAGRFNNRKIPAYFQSHFDDFFRKKNIYNDFQKQEYFRNFLDDLGNEFSFSSGNSDIFLITSEHFHSRLINIESIYNLKFFLDKFFNEYKIICYFREQSSVRNSLYSTALRGGYTGKLSEFQRDVKEDNHYYNYFEMLFKWESVFGIDSICANIFDNDLMFNNDIRKDFIRNVSPNINLDDLDYSITSSNEKLSPVLMYIYRAVNDVIPKTLDNDKRNRVRHAILKNVDKFKDLRVGKIINEENEDFARLFRQSNKDFFYRYFPQKTAFAAPKNENDRNLNIDAEQFEDVIYDVVREVLASVMKSGQL